MNRAAEPLAPTRPARTWLPTTAILVALVVVSTAGRALSLFDATGALPVGDDVRLGLLRGELQTGLAWCVAAPAIAWLGSRFVFGRVAWPRLLLVHLTAGCAIAAAVQLCEPRRAPIVVVGHEHATLGGPPGDDPLQQMLGDLAANLGAEVADQIQARLDRPGAWPWYDLVARLATYTLLAGVASGLTYRRLAIDRERAAAAAERELARSELRALRAQLQPHFLFNALNSVHVLLDDDLERGKRMLQQLATLLRASLHCIDKPEVPLRQELDVLQHYVEIERIRFQDRIRITIDVAAGLDAVQVPPFCVQPLVENALRHGPGAVARGGAIAVRARRCGAELLLEVADDGPGAAADAARPTGGFGVRNVRERLRRLYGDRARLDLAAPPHGGFVATIRVPIGPAAMEAKP
ncbi:MAG: histidine kinase [Planctomycetes bacterium]|nr:histidine kinase [Planctomycetota bacterium]